MKLDAKEFKRFKELSAKVKAGKASNDEKAELDALAAKKNERGSNDLEWWKNYPDLLKDVVNLPFNWIPGTTVDVISSGTTTVPLILGNIAIAKLDPAIGLSTDDSSPFNTQIRQLWLDMHRKYRGIGAYQKSDLGIMILAIQSVFETIAKFERIYGVINTYHVGNRVVPNGIKDALGISNDLEINLAQFRYTLNLYIEKARQLCLPKGLSILMSDIVAVSNLFKDSANRRAFIFGFDTNSYGIFDGAMTNTGGTAIGSVVKYQEFAFHMSDSTPGGYDAFTLTDVQTILDVQINALLNDDDVAIMCSDLLAAYGPENVMTLMSVPEDYKIEPVQDYERSLQFHNLTIVGTTASIYHANVIDVTLANSLLTQGYAHVVYQYDNSVICKLGQGQVGYVTSGSFNYPKYASAAAEYGMVYQLIFDTWVDQPGEQELMCGTRYSSLVEASPTVVDSSYHRRAITVYGSKVVTGVDVFSYTSTGYIVNRMTGTIVTEAQFKSNYTDYCRIAQMDWAPIFYVIDSSSKLTLFGDIDNFTKIDFDNLSRLHEVALLSGYKIPMVSSTK